MEAKPPPHQKNIELLLLYGTPQLTILSGLFLMPLLPYKPRKTIYSRPMYCHCYLSMLL